MSVAAVGWGLRGAREEEAGEDVDAEVVFWGKGEVEVTGGKLAQAHLHARGPQRVQVTVDVLGGDDTVLAPRHQVHRQRSQSVVVGRDVGRAGGVVDRSIGGRAAVVVELEAAAVDELHEVEDGVGGDGGHGAGVVVGQLQRSVPLTDVAAHARPYDKPHQFPESGHLLHVGH
eukprot:CAMPEP_0177787428 /NCGR_PEP_ID=MMETSP0491_2-20121128/21492_1 /TAXON_ID=63592 /ORGANISM="Tetraselmis chuii, Strain PLY429" /LENGTH=172 /DNA_ID=CAMNT_0019308787 /DNA_START=82 /DNA_END=601 /DNA_ORIENTATION=+